jgi:hypothetical protein
MHYILLSDPEMYVGGSWQDFTGWKVNVQELLTICLFMILWWEDRLIKSTILPPFQLLLIYAATRRERLKPWIITLWCSTLTIPKERTISCIQSLFFFFFDLRGVSGPAYAHHDYSSRPTGHPASPGAGKAPPGWQACT